MQDDDRCCGTGTCIIDAAGRCWCGQQWDGEKMCSPALPAVEPESRLLTSLFEEQRPPLKAGTHTQKPTVG